jgi:hypothetical protein
LYDVATTADELLFGVQKVLDDCEMLHREPKELLAMYYDFATQRQRMNRDVKIAQKGFNIRE